MSYYMYEAVENNQGYPAKVFMVSIEQSRFHWHYEYEFILVLKGSITIACMPRQTELKAGDIYLVNSKAVHEIRKTSEENICLIIQINPRLFRDFVDDDRTYFFYLNSRSKDLLPKKPYKEFVKTAAIIGYESYRRDMIGYYRIRGLLYELIADLFEYVQYDIHQGISKERDKENAALLYDISTFVQENFSSETVYEDLYKEVGMSEKAVYRFLKTNIGMSAKELVMAKKIETAKSLLKFTDKAIPYIVDECCFGSENAFYRTFKKEVGITPNEYRTTGIMPGKENTCIKQYLDYEKSDATKLLLQYSV